MSSRPGTSRSTQADKSRSTSASKAGSSPGAAPNPSSTTAPRKTRPTCPRLERQAELDNLGKSFRRVFRNLRRLRGRDTHLVGSEVSHAQFELLIELYERGPLPAGELAAAAQLTPATVTQMLDHLALSGHVERTRSDTDRRIVVTCLTALGRRKVQDKRALWQARWEQALGELSAEELRMAALVLDRLGAMFDDAPPGSCGRD
jgi:DNA-binding MarR family transcriptional regulator